MMNKDKLKNKYKNGMSVKDIATELNVSESGIIYWMNKYKIRRSRSDANYIKYNPNGDPFKIKRNLTEAEKKLKY